MGALQRLVLSIAVGSAVLFAAGGALAADEARYDTVILGARVVDPETGLDTIRNIGIEGDEIAAVTADEISGAVEIDGAGLVAAPGFIDLHVHGQDPYSEKLGVLDGRTSQLDLEAGAIPVSAYYDYKAGRSISNYGASVGLSFARVRVMDGIDSEGIGMLNHTLQRTAATGNQWASRVATDDELDRIDELLEQGLDEGGLGVGVLPGYYSDARSEGLVRVAKIASDRGSFLTTHSRYISLVQPSGVLGIQEMIALATSYGVPLLVHHVPTNALADTRTVLDMIDSANENGARIVGEMFPYVRGSTFIGARILDDGWQQRMDMDYDDLQWVETGETLTKESLETYRRERPDGLFIMEHIKRADMMAALIHPGVIVGSDGMVFVDEKGDLLPADAPFGAGRGHPRGAGTHGTYLRLAIDEGGSSLPRIVAKTSYLPAAFLEDHVPSMKRRGRLQTGMIADITLFDPERVDGVADYAKGTNSVPSTGFVHVFVNGQAVVRDGKLVDGVFPGEPIRGARAPD